MNQYVNPQYMQYYQQNPMFNPNAQMINDRMSNITNPQPQQIQQQVQNQIPCQFVTTIDEAKAFMISNPILPCVFLDKTTNKVYIKEISNIGTASFRTYSMDITAPQPVSKPEENPLETRLNSVEQELIKLKSEYNNLKDKYNERNEYNAISSNAKNSSKPNGDTSWNVGTKSSNSKSNADD